MLSIFLAIIALMPVQIAKLAEIPAKFTVVLDKLYLLGPGKMQIYILEGDSVRSIYRSPSPLVSISSDGLFLYTIEKTEAVVISSDGKRIGTIKSGRFRDLSVNSRGFIYLLNWKGDRITVLRASEEEFTLTYPADEIRASEKGRIAVRSGNLIKLFDNQFSEIAEIRTSCTDFCFFRDELYIAGDSCLFRFDEKKSELKPALQGSFRLLAPSSKILYLINETGTILAISPTN